MNIYIYIYICIYICTPFHQISVHVLVHFFYIFGSEVLDSNGSVKGSVKGSADGNSADGLGGGGYRLGWGHIKILYKAPKDYTKTQKTTQSPEQIYKAPTDYTKPRQTIQSSKKTIQSPGKSIRRLEIFNKSSNKY